MDERDAIEQAYKNGFEAGVKEFAERLKEKLYGIPTVYNSHFSRLVDTLVEEMTVNYESSKNDMQRKEKEI